MTGNYVFETGSMTGILVQLKWESLKKRRKDSRLMAEAIRTTVVPISGVIRTTVVPISGFIGPTVVRIANATGIDYRHDGSIRFSYKCIKLLSQVK